MTRQQFLISIIADLTKQDPRGIRLEKIWQTIEAKAGRDIDKAQVVITLAELITDKKVKFDLRSLRIGGPDGEKEKIPFYQLA